MFYSLNVTESLERNEASPRKSGAVVVIAVVFVVVGGVSTHGRFAGTLVGSGGTGRLTFGLTFFGV